MASTSAEGFNNGFLRRDIVVLGASAGGVEALVKVVSALPTGLPAAVYIVLHSSPGFESTLPEILGRQCRLPVTLAVHGEAIRPGRILIAPADNHLTLESRFVRVVRGPKDNGHRPAVDPLFQTAARSFGPRVLAAVLSGTLSCGTRGLHAVKARGGLTVVQDPDDAPFDGMPRSALAYVQVDHVLPARAIGALIGELAGARVEGLETQVMSEDEQHAGFPAITCPECSGSMQETDAGGMPVFACHVGHVFSLDSLVHEQGAALEAALWAAVRSLEESAEMARRVSTHSTRELAQRFDEKAAALLQHAEVLKELLTTGQLINRTDAGTAHKGLVASAAGEDASAPP